MNPSDPNDLSRTLADWRVNPKADPNFRPAVWQRIQQRSRETWGSYVQGHLAGWAVASVVAVVGATFTGPDTAELLHAATIAIVGAVPLDVLWHAVPAFPTLSEVWLRLLETYGL